MIGIIELVLALLLAVAPALAVLARRVEIAYPILFCHWRIAAWLRPGDCPPCT